MDARADSAEEQFRMDAEDQTTGEVALGEVGAVTMSRQPGGRDGGEAVGVLGGVLGGVLAAERFAAESENSTMEAAETARKRPGVAELSARIAESSGKAAGKMSAGIVSVEVAA